MATRPESTSHVHGHSRRSFGRVWRGLRLGRSRSPLGLSVLGALIVAVSACDDGTSTELSTEPEPEWLACEADSECVIVSLGCCDRCNGGRVIAVDQAFSDVARNALRTPNEDCPGTCSLAPCTDTTVTRCNAGMCEWEAVPLCGTIAPESCGDYDHCVALSGTGCSSGATEVRGCADAGGGCAAVETCAVDPESGEEVIFSSGCTPGGWANCPTPMCSTCESLDETTCDANAECDAITGSDCLSGDPVYAGCVPNEGLGCDDLPTCVIDPDTSRAVVFPDTCVPPTWTDTCGPNSCSPIP